MIIMIDFYNHGRADLCARVYYQASTQIANLLWQIGDETLAQQLWIGTVASVNLDIQSASWQLRELLIEIADILTSRHHALQHQQQQQQQQQQKENCGNVCAM
jgi:hypothetical protein